MDEPAIRAEGLGKRYRLGRGLSEDSLSERFGRLISRRRDEPSIGAGEPDDQELWALRDVSFELRMGEALGLVGRNGAGKSTLLKLLSKITLPSEGRVTMHGRTATLLEVGTGFHPELTGRENVYLNGSILGMRRREIDARYDEIVEFSGIERFLETPVKRYSSGMYVRLAFAVAAHLEPEILLVDEVLAVGDTEFQRKCLGKMRKVAGEGRAVVFVSHNLNAVQRLCDRAFLIDGGRLVRDDVPDKVVSEYLAKGGPQSESGVTVVPEDAPRIGTAEARLRRVAMSDTQGNPITSVYLGQPFRVTLTYEVFEPIEEAAFEVGISTPEGDQVATAQSIDGDRPPVSIAPGMQEVTVEMPVSLLPHEFCLDAALHRMTGVTVDHVSPAHRFAALNVAEHGDDHYHWPVVRGYVRPASEWSEVKPAAAADGTVKPGQPQSF